jgi:type IV pilus assembly protein PilQ
MMISPRIQVVALVLAAIGASPPARADGKNEVRAVTFDEDSGITRVHVRGAQTPTFTVYKLDRPPRVVVDLPQARLGDALRGHDSAAVLTPSTWAVSTIAAQQLDDNAVRVIVTLARPGRYDVKTDGNELIVMVMPRDPAPKTASPEELEQAQQQARTAEAARAEAEKASAAAKAQVAQAQGEAERLRQVAADQAARAEAAQHAADEARAAQAKSAASSADLERAKATTAKAQAEAARAKSDAAKASEQAQAAQGELDRLHAAQRDAAAETQKARDELARTQAEMTRLQKQAELAKQDAERARREADAKTAEADAAKRDAAKLSAQSHSDADRAKQDAARVLAQADAAKQDAERARRDADAKSAEAVTAKRDVDAKQAELDAKQRDLATKQTELATQRTQLASQRDELTTKQNELDAEKRDLVKRSELTRAEAEAAKADVAREKLAATNARVEAEHAKADAARSKADADAELAKAAKLMTDAKHQLAAIDAKTANAQALEDQARATHAAAEAREETARDAEAKAIHERELAATEAKHAQDARDRAAASDRAKLADEARAADDRLAAAKRATADAETRRIAAEQAAQAAKRDLDQTKTTLATVEQQRAATEAAATDAARRRSDAEAAASDAVRRRGEAEAAVAEAAKKRSEAERAASAAETARAAADKQRAVAEAATHAAETTKTDAESSLAELTARRAAAEKAAAELDARTRAEAKAQAEIAAAKARKAGEDELATARAEAARLADDRKHAETALAERRKAVASQQAEVGRLETAAAQAKDAADREDARRTKLAQQREDEERALSTLKKQVADAKQASGDKPGPGLAPRGSGAKPAPIRVADVPKPVTPKFADSPKAQVSDIRFRGDQGAAQVDLAVTGSPDVHLGEVTADHVELIVDHAALGAKLERTLDVSKFGSPVRSVSSFRDRRNPDRVRLVVELSQAATSTVERDGTAVHWKFAGSHVAHTTDVPAPVIGGFGATSTPIAQESISQVGPTPGRRRIYHGATVDLDFKDAPLHDLLRVIADTGHVNLIVPDTIEAKVTVRLKRVPWDQALDEILASHGLWYRREGNIYRIATRKDLDAEDEQEAARRKAAQEAEAPKPEIIRLNYASATELKPKLETMLSPHGHIQVEERTNALIVTDVGGNREQIARLALQLDTQTPQITIEARIVEANSDYVREIGVQWGGNALSGAAGGNATGLIFPSSVGISGANEDNATKNFGVSLPSDFAVNIPAATGSGEGGAIGMSLGSVASNLNINLRLSALEDVGTVRIISAPKITVLNNKQAEIRQGVSIPISVVSAAGTQTQFVQADLKLTVTPYVSLRDCQIAMTLDVSKNEPDFVNVGARGDPTIVRKEAHTTMLVADGETSVLGGIYTRNSGLAYKKVPFFGDLPFIGWLFKNRRENDNRTEVLVFITPKITNKASLTCTQ